MYRIVRRPRILLLTLVHEMVITTLGVAGLAGIVLVGVLSAFTLSR